MNKFILTMVTFVAISNPIKIIAKEFLVTQKAVAQDMISYIEGTTSEIKGRILDVVPLDNDKDGFVSIVYEFILQDEIKTFNDYL